LDILAFDTATDKLSLALGKAEHLVAESSIMAPREHMERLMPAIDRMFKETEHKLEDLDAIAVGTGPGSFTGVRIGVSTARALAQSLEKTLIGIPTADCLAYGIDWDGTIACVIDAKRGELYSAFYQSRGHSIKRTKDFEIVTPEGFCGILEEHEEDNVIVAGDALCEYGDFIKGRMASRIEFAPADKWYPEAGNLIRLALCELDQPNSVQDGLLTVQPIYIRLSQAEEVWRATQGARISIVSLERMVPGDVDALLDIERNLFPSPWTQWMFRAEINNEICFAIVARLEGRIVGYGLLNYIGEEAHLMNLAVTPEIQNLGIGSAMLIRLLEFGSQRGVKKVTLEVRPSNTAARELYRKFGFEQVGIRKKYYTETNEDGLILWTGDITDNKFKDVMKRIKAQAGKKLMIVDKII
jgi:tRNA threonylcarbamoyl adenosine modification protein YeaZ/ribosomal-protein-alanine acetyltransferase